MISAIGKSSALIKFTSRPTVKLYSLGHKQMDIFSDAVAIWQWHCDLAFLS
jgi:hypothetical protein